MRGASKLLLALAAAVLLAVGVAACGGGSSSTPSTTTSSTASPVAAGTTPTTQKSAPPKASGGARPKKVAKSSGSSSNEPNASFETHGGDNSIQESGTEGSTSELDQAAAALHGYLDARAAGNWVKACSYMATSAQQPLEQYSTRPTPTTAKGKQLMKKLESKAGKVCPAFLAGTSAGMPAYLRHDLVQADVGSLRVKGDNAFLLYHGAHNTDFFMPMVKENGEWKVGNLTASAMP